MKQNSRYDPQRLMEPATKSAMLLPRRIVPLTGVLEYVIQDGDRLDHLSRHFYNNDRLWYRILDANPQITEMSMLLSELTGQTILIPRAE